MEGRRTPEPNWWKWFVFPHAPCFPELPLIWVLKGVCMTKRVTCFSIFYRRRLGEDYHDAPRAQMPRG